MALERRDVDRAGGVVYVRRQLVRGQVKQTKTRRSIRAVPLQSAALEALEQRPSSDSRLLFLAPQGGYIVLHKFLPRQYATFALRSGISIFDLGASLAMIDRYYVHLARDGRDHAVALLDAYAHENAAWTPGGRRRRTRKPAWRRLLRRR